MSASYAVKLTALLFLLLNTLEPAVAQTKLLDQKLIIPKECQGEIERSLTKVFVDPRPGKFRKLFHLQKEVWDEESLRRTTLRIDHELKQMGFLNSSVMLVCDSSHKSGYIAEYFVKSGKRWKLGSIEWDADLSGLPIDALQKNTLINSNDHLVVSILEQERHRITEEANHMGFATLNEGFIHFEIDTSRKSGYADLLLQIRGQRIGETSQPIPHKKIKIGNIFYDQSCMKNPISSDELNYLIMLNEGDNFDPYLFESTYRRLSAVSSIGSVELAKDYPLNINSNHGTVDVTVALKSSSRYNIAFELDMTRADTRFGPLSKVTWKNKNLRGKGDVLSWTTTASYASTQLFSQSEVNLIPNTGELGFQCSYRTIGLPGVGIEKLPKSTYAHSELIVNAARETRPEYHRSFVNMLYRLDWTENPERNSKIALNPLMVSYVRIEADDDFQQWLIDSEDPLLQYRFSDYSILGSMITWTQNSTSNNVSSVITTSGEWSGLLTKKLSPYLFYDVPLIQYVRLDGSLVLKGDVRGGKTWATRFRAGSAWIGSETEALPYDRGFFGGGANGVRGWPVRELGPTGALQGVGDMRVDASFEVRNKITDAFIIALFSDVGNVWLHDSIDKIKDIALSLGVSFRYDFDFFLVRIDSAVRLHDPTQNQGEKWLIQGPLKGGVHFGLGHPF